MPELTISSVVILPTMRAVVSFAASTDPDLHHYLVSGVAGLTHEVEATGTATMISAGVLVPKLSYTWTVQALDEDDVVLATGAALVAAATIECTAAAVLRQAFCDVLAGEALTVGGRALTVLRDAYGRPRTIYEDENIVRRTPLLEIAHPKLAGYNGQTGARNVEAYTIECTVVEAIRPGMHDEALESAMVARDKVRLAIDRELYGTVGGVHDGSWSWQDGELIYDDQVLAMRVICSIQVQAHPEGLPYS